jgi:hypothetical protein
MSTPSQTPRSVKYTPPPLAGLLPDLRRVSHKECHGPCPFCGGTDRFIAWENGYGWCRQCHWKGDSIQLLRDRDHLTFQEALRQLRLDYAVPSRQVRRLASVHSLALAKAKDAYRTWQRKRVTALTDHLLFVAGELAIAEAAYRQIHRRPDLYTDEERRYWTRTLGTLYDRHAALTDHLEHALDVLTYERNEADRFAWWQEQETRKESV